MVDPEWVLFEPHDVIADVKMFSSPFHVSPYARWGDGTLPPSSTSLFPSTLHLPASSLQATFGS
jgi:hypothetical protein